MRTTPVDAVTVERSRPRRDLVFAGAAVLALFFALGAETVSIVRGFGGNHVLELLSGLAYLWAGLYAMHRRPGNPIGALLVIYGGLWFLPFWASLLPYHVDAVVTVISGAATAILVHIALSFPDGRIVHRFAGVVIVGTYAWTLVSTFAAEATWDRGLWARDGWDCAAQYCRATLSFWPSESLNDAVSSAGNIMTFVVISATASAFWQRWRHSTAAQRRDLRPMWATLLLVASVYAADAVAGLLDAGPVVFEVLLQVRSLVQLAAPLLIVWGLVTARTAGSAVGELMLASRRSLRGDEIEGALQRALRDPSARLLHRVADGTWRDGSGAAADVPDQGDDVAFAYGSDGMPLAALVHDPGLDPSAVAAAAAVAGLALENTALHDEVIRQLADVRASRARIVAAGDHERTRVERDLHDGAQQRLLALSMQLRAAQKSARTPELIAALQRANDELSTAIRELRELARGIRPPLLAEAGIGPAVRSLADRSTVPVVHLEVITDRFAPELESAVYFVVAEALANSAKHARARSIRISVLQDAEQLTVEVGDDGVGGASPSRGSGIAGLDDRVAAVGGRLDVVSPPGEGTVIRARIPLGGDS